MSPRWARLLPTLRWRARQAAEQPGLAIGVLATCLVIAVLAAAGSGSVELPLWRVPEVLAEPSHPLHAVLTRVRLPRLVAAMEVGAGLAVAGLLLQTTLRNPLADAGLLGVSAGAGLAAIAVLTLWPAAGALAPLAAFGGGLAAVALLLLAAVWSGQGANPMSLLLAGVALQAILFACVAVMTLLFADRAPAFVAFTVGSLTTTGWHDVALASAPLGLGIAGAWISSRALDVLLFDEASATSLGLSVPRTRLVMAGFGALLAAAAVSLAGLVGFVGLLVPNAVRLALGGFHRTRVPLCAIGGALLVVLADLGARTVVAPIELPVGAVLALLGGPFFLYLLYRGIDR